MRTRLALIAVSLLLCVVTEGAAEAATYYVSSSGNDGNSCGQAQASSTPKQTINSAIGCLVAGDTLLVRAGNYPEWLSIGVVPSGSSWTSRVRIAAYPGDGHCRETLSSGIIV